MAQRICSFEGCERPHAQNNLCDSHDWQRRKGRRLTPIRSRTWPERFWDKVEKTDSCWLWKGAIQGAGYGSIWYDDRICLAHRVAYELTRSKVPDGLTLDHLCRVRSCVNPAHLEPVTNRENVLRGVAPLAKNARKTHCIHGHPFDEVNTLVRHTKYGTFTRHCLTCKRAADAARNASRKAS